MASVTSGVEVQPVKLQARLSLGFALVGCLLALVWAFFFVKIYSINSKSFFQTLVQAF